MFGRRHRGRNQKSVWTRRAPIIIGCVVVIVIVAASAFFVLNQNAYKVNSKTSSTSTLSSSSQSKPIILYINQDNGAVNESNINQMLQYASARGFNTIFFQMYHNGALMFTTSQLSYFVAVAHSNGFKFFFSLPFTNDSQTIPSSIYDLGEDGINLDMSTIDNQGQLDLLSTLQANYHDGITAMTTYDFTTTLRPQWLVFETYSSQYHNPQYVHSGIIASVGVFTTVSKQDYQSQFNYDLSNSDGVMVFDYYGLLKAGY
jgi:hypothetical protein